MIQQAHIGVGISGNEGLQAVMASDYAIAQFRYLERLLLVHGRYSNNRIAMTVAYSFYKSMAFALTQYIFAYMSGFSGQSLYSSWFITFFNLFHTSTPILAYAVFEQDVRQRLQAHTSAREYTVFVQVRIARLFQFPQLYATTQRGTRYNQRVFWTWMAEAAWTAFTTVRTYNNNTNAATPPTLALRS